MPPNHLVGDWQETPIRTFCALDAWLFADTPHPLVGAGRSVSGLACLPALKASRVDVLTPAKERAEQRDLFR